MAQNDTAVIGFLDNMIIHMAGSTVFPVIGIHRPQNHRSADHRPDGIVAAAICVFGVIMTIVAPESELFWTFFALNLVLFLISYLPIFPAFLKLRQVNPDAERPFKAPGGSVLLNLMAWVPFVLIVISVLFCAVPLSLDSESLIDVLPITIGAIICIALGEILILIREKKHSQST